MGGSKGIGKANVKGGAMNKAAQRELRPISDSEDEDQDSSRPGRKLKVISDSEEEEEDELVARGAGARAVAQAQASAAGYANLHGRLLASVDALHWSEEHKGYFDVGMHDE